MNAVYEAVFRLGELVLRFGQTYRGTYFADGVTPESDTDHTVMLGVVACAYAAKAAPELDLGKVAQFALVHDLVEAYAGDTRTLKRQSKEEQAEKHERERAALERIRSEFGETLPWVHETIAAYDSLESPEARFVKMMDKTMPSITHVGNRGATFREQGFAKADFPALNRERIDLYGRTFAHDQEAALDLYRYAVKHVLDSLPD